MGRRPVDSNVGPAQVNSGLKVARGNDLIPTADRPGGAVWAVTHGCKSPLGGRSSMGIRRLSSTRRTTESLGEVERAGNLVAFIGHLLRPLRPPLSRFVHRVSHFWPKEGLERRAAEREGVLIEA